MGVRVESVYSAHIEGLDGKLIKIEVSMKKGIPRFIIVGLANTSIKEASERVKIAIDNSGYEFPMQSILVNLSPAGIRKEGSWLDLGIAAGLLKVSDQLCTDVNMDHFLLIGELGLDGSIKPMKGLINILINVLNAGFTSVVVPDANRYEASLISGLKVYTIQHLSELEDILNDKIPAINSRTFSEEKKFFEHKIYLYKEQLSVLRHLIVSVTGKHHFLMFGNPGTGKTMLARLASDLQPPITEKEYIGLLRIKSNIEYLSDTDSIIVKRPFRSPHHTASDISVVGGGRDIRMGEVTLAHNGILFLDELGEFNNKVLQALREPLEEGKITISRVTGHYTYPASFLLIGASNPCPCGYFGSKERNCICSEIKIRKYLSRFSGPFMDRIDIQSEFSYTTRTVEDMVEVDLNEVYSKICDAKHIQDERFKGSEYTFNSSVSGVAADRFFVMDLKARKLLESILLKSGYSLRRVDRIRKIARTIADIESIEVVQEEHVLEAFQLNKTGEFFLNLVT